MFMGNKPLMHELVSTKTVDYVKSKKIIPNEPFYKALERILGIDGEKP